VFFLFCFCFQACGKGKKTNKRKQSVVTDGSSDSADVAETCNVRFACMLAKSGFRVGLMLTNPSFSFLVCCQE